MRPIFKFILPLCLFFVLILPEVYAQSSSISGQIIQVKGVANIVGRLGERIILFFKLSSNSKADYEQHLVKKRLGELQYVLDNGQGDLIEETTSRYSTYVGRLTNRVVKNNLTDKKEKILKMYASHSAVLEKYSLEQEYNSGFWLLLQHDINYLKLYSDQIKAAN